MVIEHYNWEFCYLMTISRTTLYLDFSWNQSHSFENIVWKEEITISMQKYLDLYESCYRWIDPFEPATSRTRGKRSIIAASPYYIDVNKGFILLWSL